MPEAPPEGTLGQTSFSFTLEPRGRRYPPGSITDTILGGRYKNDLSNSSLALFKTNEILSVITSPYEKTKVTPYGTHLVPQVGMRGCSAACTEMLVLDHGGDADSEYLRTSNLGNSRSIIDRLAKAGLKAVETKFDGQNVVFTLQEALKQHGPLILTIGNLGPNAKMCGDIAGHDLILDKIIPARNSAIVRDPFHGWQVEVLISAIVRQNPCAMIQIIGKSEDKSAAAAASEPEVLPLFDVDYSPKKIPWTQRVLAWFSRNANA